MDIHRFDSVPGENVTVEALWVVRRGPANEVRTGYSLLRTPAATQDYDALVAAHAISLSRVSEEIAEAIRTMHSSSR